MIVYSFILNRNIQNSVLIGKFKLKHLIACLFAFKIFSCNIISLLSFSTAALHAGQDPEQWKSMMVVPPITVSTTFKQHSPGDHTVCLCFYCYF